MARYWSREYKNNFKSKIDSEPVQTSVWDPQHCGAYQIIQRNRSSANIALRLKDSNTQCKSDDGPHADPSTIPQITNAFHSHECHTRNAANAKCGELLTAHSVG